MVRAVAILLGEAKLSDRSSIERIIHDCYAGRDANDVERSLKSFAPHGSFRFVGATGGSLPDRALTGAALRETVKSVIDNFDIVSRKIVSFIIEGDHAGVHSHVRVRFKPNGREVETELYDIWQFENDKIVSLTEFGDTAALEKLTR
jgi:ketosteroid isomerase-like protein